MLHRGLRRKLELISLLTVIFYSLNICLSGFTATAQALRINPPQETETKTKLNFSSSSPSEADKNKVFEKVSKLSLPFLSNQGQYDERVSFITNTFAGTLFVTREGELVYSLPVAEKREKDPASGEAEASSKTKTKGWVLKEKLIGATKTEPQGFDKAPTKVNYFTGNDKSKWKQNINTYSGVNMGEIYPEIYLNLRSYGNNVEKVFTVKPGGDVEKIRLKVEGANSLKVNNKGELEVGIGLGHVRFTKPVAYQENNGRREYIQVNYELEKDTYGFSVGDYDKSRPLVIDPLLSSTFIGGSGSDTIYSLAFDRAGNVYVAGTTFSSNYPTTVGAYDRTYMYWDAVVSKFDANLEQLLASTFISGYGYATVYAMALDRAGNVYIAGGANSPYYPTTTGAYSRTYISGSTNVFVSKFNANLNNLLASTYVSRGNVSSLAIDPSDNVIIAGTTDYSTYPTTATAFKQLYNGGTSDGFVSKLDPNLSNLLASTFIGGSGTDKARSLAISLEGNIYVTGATNSTNYPTTEFAFDRTYNGGVNDAFISKIDVNLSNLAYSTYIGGTFKDEAYSLALGSDGTVYIAGITDIPRLSHH